MIYIFLKFSNRKNTNLCEQIFVFLQIYFFIFFNIFLILKLSKNNKFYVSSSNLYILKYLLSLIIIMNTINVKQDKKLLIICFVTNHIVEMIN